MTIELIEHADRTAQAVALAGLVADDVRQAKAANGAATIAVPGGTTPRAFLERLAKSEIDWSALTVMATDERWKPLSDPRSNAAMISAALGGRGRILSFFDADRTPGEAAAQLSRKRADAPPLASVVLGMGADMHCASLFPGAPELIAAMAPEGAFASAMTPGDGLEPRVTLTLRTLAAANVVRLQIFGEEKRAAFEAAMAMSDPLLAPIAGVLRSARRAEAHWAP